ncbi:MAG: ACR3 family arsenite efflux transporter [SAR202 cluster bacterium]|nr:MAG: ACR3 family arsenite efflux transporter [SAR202 cluster bacterium]
MGIFEKYLTFWVGLSIAGGVILGNWFPEFFETIADIEFANVNLIVAIFIWIMIYPMMVQIDFTSVKEIGNKPKGLILTIIVNWLIKPFTMAALGILFFEVIYEIPGFDRLIDDTKSTEYIAGMILLGVAPCTAMVFVWSQLTKGDPNYTLVQVSINDLIMIFAFVPIAGLLLGMSNEFADKKLELPWDTLIISVLLYVLLPLLAGIMTRQILVGRKSRITLNSFLNLIKPWSILGLLSTVVLLFGFQATVIIDQPAIIGLIAIPLLIQTYGIFAIAYVTARFIRLKHEIAAPACLIGTSNFFELAVAVAISLFGLNSGAALATVVGVLVEVPVMLSLVYFVNKTKHLFPSND